MSSWRELELDMEFALDLLMASERGEEEGSTEERRGKGRERHKRT